MAESVRVPEPPGWPIVGHAIGYIDEKDPMGTFERLIDEYGRIYRIWLIKRPLTFVSSHKLVEELCDEKRFRKVPDGVMKELRSAANDGLLTAYLTDANWGIAHRILMPAFGPTALRGMFDDMYDIATQLCMKWARMGTERAFNPAEDFTRLAMDTIALCSMNYRFNSFYNPDTHPFLQAMARTLINVRKRARRGTSRLMEAYFAKEREELLADIAFLRKVSDDVVAYRQKHPSDRKDLVAAMLNDRDPKTGQKMTAKNITDNMLVFLVAGHETTVGMMTFALYYLMKNPRVMDKLRREVDGVVGRGQVSMEQLSKFPYMQAVFREALRLDPPLPVWAVEPYEDTLLGGKYLIRKDETCIAFLRGVQRDPEVYGADANEFRPERMLDEPFNELPPSAWKPFGNGQRSCIGRGFAMQEATLLFAMLLQNFEFELEDPAYTLEYLQTLTMKPKNFRIRTRLRHNLTPSSLQFQLAGVVPPASASPASAVLASSPELPAQTPPSSSLKPLAVRYGSNSGACQTLAALVASHAAAHGFCVSSIDHLDAAVDALPTDQPVVVVTTSYEGQPTDDARAFVAWLDKAAADNKSLAGVGYAVFGLGHHDWAKTFHRIPRLVDDHLAAAGATRLVPIGLCDVAAQDMFPVFEAWEDEQLWPLLQKQYGIEAPDVAGLPLNAASGGLAVSLTSPRAALLHQYVAPATVVSSKTLTAPGEPPKMHLEIRLPPESAYTAGDYLAVLPMNPRETVARVLRHFRLPWDAHATIVADQSIPLPAGDAVVADLLAAYVELGQVATKKNVAALARLATEADAAVLTRLAGDDYAAEIAAKYTSVLDLLERFPVDLSLGAFLSMLPPMRVRKYSISSSPLANKDTVSLTVSVFDLPAKARPGRHIGVASSYLASLTPCDTLQVAVRPSHASFHLPPAEDRATTPLILVAAGSGLAPFRGFIQERAALASAGLPLAPALLFHGCREPGHDDLYAAELAEWVAAGVVEFCHAYSRTPEKAGGSRYVQDALWAKKSRVEELWTAGARLYICGSRSIAEAVGNTMQLLYRDQSKRQDKAVTLQESRDWWASLRNERYSVDVFD